MVQSTFKIPYISIFRVKIENFAIKIYLERRKNRAIQLVFLFIPISRSVAEIKRLKISIALKIRERMGPTDL